MAMLMRAELARPGTQFCQQRAVQPAVHHARHDHAAAVRDAAVRRLRQRDHAAADRRRPDVAFPRLNMLSYWLFLFGGLIAMIGFLTPGGAAGVRLVRLRAAVRRRSTRPGVGGDLWIMGLALAGFGTILGAVNFITTIFCMRAPGMTMFRMPIFTWNILLTSVLVLMAFPVLAAALLVLEADRKFGAHVFDPANGGAILWQHLFWFFGHPEVYIIALPFFGIVSEILPVFSRKPIFGYKGLVFATIAIAGLSVTVWAHHMFPTGAVLLPFFSLHDVPHRRADRREVLQLDRHDVARLADLRDADAVVDRLPGDVPVRRPDRHDPGLAAAGLPGLRHLLRGGALPLRRVRHRRVRDVRRLLLLVAEDDRPDARRAAGQDPLLDAVRRLPHDVPGPALARRRGHAAPLRRLPRQRRLHDAEHDLDDRLLPARRLDAAVPLQRHARASNGPEGHHRRPVGLRPLAGVGDVLPAAAAQLPRAAADPLRAPGVRPALPARRRAGPRRPRTRTCSTRSRRARPRAVGTPRRRRASR